MARAAEDPETDFVEAARQHGENTQIGVARQTNRAYHDLVAALRELRKRPDKGQPFLLSCLSNANWSVVGWAALYLLSSNEKDAIAALERVIRSGERLIAFDAEMTLKEWRAGRLTIE